MAAFYKYIYKIATTAHREIVVPSAQYLPARNVSVTCSSFAMSHNATAFALSIQSKCLNEPFSPATRPCCDFFRLNTFYLTSYRRLSAIQPDSRSSIGVAVLTLDDVAMALRYYVFWSCFISSSVFASYSIVLTPPISPCYNISWGPGNWIVSSMICIVCPVSWSWVVELP